MILALSCGVCYGHARLSLPLKECADHVHVPLDHPDIVSWSNSHLYPVLEVLP